VKGTTEEAVPAAIGWSAVFAGFEIAAPGEFGRGTACSLRKGKKFDDLLISRSH
jgi:hypothetical protein